MIEADGDDGADEGSQTQRTLRFHMDVAGRIEVCVFVWCAISPAGRGGSLENPCVVCCGMICSVFVCLVSCRIWLVLYCMLCCMECATL